jgi:uncharacterized cupin superfamily protein
MSGYFHALEKRGRMPNLNDPQFDDIREGEGFEALRARLGRQAGAERLGMSLWEVPPGTAAYPYHWHMVEEEMVIVLEGRPSLRGPEGGWRELEPGEVVSFPTGEEGAHQLWNRGDSTVRFLSFSSTTNDPEICFYPDSGKVGIWAQELHELHLRENAVDYWDGEEPPATAGSSSA